MFCGHELGEGVGVCLVGSWVGSMDVVGSGLVLHGLEEEIGGGFVGGHGGMVVCRGVVCVCAWVVFACVRGWFVCVRWCLLLAFVVLFFAASGAAGAFVSFVLFSLWVLCPSID